MLSAVEVLSASTTKRLPAEQGTFPKRERERESNELGVANEAASFKLVCWNYEFNLELQDSKKFAESNFETETY